MNRRWAVYREQLVGFVDGDTQIGAYYAAEKEYGRNGRIIRVQAAGAGDSDERIDRETEAFGHWKNANNDQDQDGA